MCFSIHGKIPLIFVKSWLKIEHETHTTFLVSPFFASVEVRNQKNVSLGGSFKKILCVNKSKDAGKQDMNGENKKQTGPKNSFSSAKLTTTE